MTTKLSSVAFTAAEKKCLNTIVQDTNDIEIELFRDECISVILFGLAHVKTPKAKIETLKSVFSSMREWSTDGASSQKISNEISNKPIVQHALQVIKEQEPQYSVDMPNASDAASSHESGKKKGRGMAKAKAQAKNRACAARKILREADELTSSVTQSTVDTKRRRIEADMLAKTPVQRKKSRNANSNIRDATTPVSSKI